MTNKIGRKPLEYYLALKYPITIEAAPEGGYFTEIEDLHGCYSQGETIEEAMQMIEEARRLWLESAYEDKLDIPLPANEIEYSGKFNVRVPVSLHRKLHRLAGKEGVSLNQYVVFALSHTAGAAENQPPFK
jgi:predicted RNase H-like HicB family nuclease